MPRILAGFHWRWDNSASLKMLHIGAFSKRTAKANYLAEHLDLGNFFAGILNAKIEHFSDWNGD